MLINVNLKIYEKEVIYSNIEYSIKSAVDTIFNIVLMFSGQWLSKWTLTDVTFENNLDNDFYVDLTVEESG